MKIIPVKVDREMKRAQNSPFSPENVKEFV